MVRRDVIRKPCWHALSGVTGLCALVGALVGVTLHDADHAFDEGDVHCGLCLHADRLDGAATTAASIPAMRPRDASGDVRWVDGVVSFRVAKEHRQRAPPSTG